MSHPYIRNNMMNAIENIKYLISPSLYSGKSVKESSAVLYISIPENYLSWRAS